jgi:3-dehydro-4-phosphotetronate decarboxylase
MNEDEARSALIVAARSLFSRGLTHGSTGNLSVRVGERILVTPTGSSLGTVASGELSVIDASGAHLSGPRPSKEAFLHAAILRARPGDTAVVHTHSTYAAALSCLDGLDEADALPPLTAYFAMRIGRLPLLPYCAPGDAALGAAVGAAASSHHALLLRNHGPVVSAPTLAAATDALEELEQTAKLYFLLAGHPTRPLTPAQVAALR